MLQLVGDHPSQPLRRLVQDTGVIGRRWLLKHRSNDWQPQLANQLNGGSVAFRTPTQCQGHPSQQPQLVNGEFELSQRLAEDERVRTMSKQPESRRESDDLSWCSGV